jgi:hypothetical protein
MWKDQDLEYFLKMSAHNLETAQESVGFDSIALAARLSSGQGVQALLVSLKVFESDLEEVRHLARQSEINYNKALTAAKSSTAMYSNLSIAYGIQALIWYLECQKRTG